MTISVNAFAVSKPLNPIYKTGKTLRVVQASFASVNGTTASGDIFVLASGLPATARIVRVMTPKGTPAVTGMSDVDLGFYATGTNKVIDKDAVADGLTFASAITSNLDLVGKNISSFDQTKNIAALCGLTAESIPAQGFDLCATLNASPTASGTIEFDIYIEQE
jgi:hypothetical protein